MVFHLDLLNFGTCVPEPSVAVHPSSFLGEPAAEHHAGEHAAADAKAAAADAKAAAADAKAAAPHEKEVVPGAVKGPHHFTFYYADFCPHCKAFKPAWFQAKEAWALAHPDDKNLRWNEVQCADSSGQPGSGAAECEHQQIRGLPTVRYAEDTGPEAPGTANFKRFEDYDGDRTTGSVLRFVGAAENFYKTGKFDLGAVPEIPIPSAPHAADHAADH